MIDMFYINDIDTKFPAKPKVGDIFVIEEYHTPSVKFVEYENASDLFYEQHQFVYGLVEWVSTEGTGFNKFTRIKGRLLNAQVVEEDMKTNPFSNDPYVAEGMLKYTERSSWAMKRLNPSLARRLKKEYKHWFI